MIACVAGEGDEVVVPEPAYATYEGVIAAAGARMVHVPLPPERDFRLRVDDVAAALTPRTRAVLVNTPHNPTGAAMTAAELAELVALCAARDVWLVSDEVYGALTFARPHASALAAPGADGCVAVLSSLSKSHAMTGFRHGWAIVPAPLADAIDYLLQAMLFGSPPFVQDAGLAALAEGDAASAAMRDAYERRARVVVDALAATPAVRARHAGRRHVRAGRRARDGPRRADVRRPPARRGGGQRAARRPLRPQRARPRAHRPGRLRGACSARRAAASTGWRAGSPSARLAPRLAAEPSR